MIVCDSVRDVYGRLSVSVLLSLSRRPVGTITPFPLTNTNLWSAGGNLTSEHQWPQKTDRKTTGLSNVITGREEATATDSNRKKNAMDFNARILQNTLKEDPYIKHKIVHAF